VLLVRCQNARTEAFINWSSFLGSDNLNVTSRIDKAAAVTTSWNISTDHKASFVP
jgi:type VI secretion system protein VasI